MRVLIVVLPTFGVLATDILTFGYVLMKGQGDPVLTLDGAVTAN